MATIHKIERAQRRELLAASEAYYAALSRELASSAIDVVKEELASAVEAITKEIAVKASSPFMDGKVWFTVAELKERWSCSNNFISSIADLEPHYIGSSSAMKRYLAVDVYRVEGLITKAKHKELKEI